LRPFSGSACTCSGSTRPDRLDFLVSTSGDSPVTVTVSCSVATFIVKLIATDSLTAIRNPSRMTVLKPESSAVTL
jgi:hypothetical protein